jgi:hypothetical protein
MHKLVATIGIVFLLLSLNSTLTYADTEGVVEVVNIYDLSREYYTLKEVYDILGVRVTLENDHSETLNRWREPHFYLYCPS